MSTGNNLTRSLLSWIADQGCARCHYYGEFPEACGECLPCLAYDYREERQPDTFTRIVALLHHESERAFRELMGASPSSPRSEP